MGYSFDSLTGRLVCDVCGNADGTTRKRKCPFGYCPAPAICKSCWNKPDVREKDRAYHIKNDCKGSHEKFQRQEEETRLMLADGMRLRCAALSTDDGRVHVIFRHKDGNVGAYMKHATYNTFPLLENHTWEDYEAVEDSPLQPAPAHYY